MPLPGIIIGALVLLLVLAVTAVVVNAVRRSRRGSAAIEERGWQRLPDRSDVTAGWDGWPFLEAIEPGQGHANDIVVGHLDGVDFMSLRWHQREPDPGEPGGETERYNIVALRVEQTYPHLTVVRGDNRLHRREQTAAVTAFDAGDRRFDRRWQTLGDPDFGRALLTPEVCAVMEEHGHAWVFQPGWVTRVTPWTFWAGEDRMLEEIEHLAAPFRLAPPQAWSAHGGPPRFVTSLTPR